MTFILRVNFQITFPHRIFALQDELRGPKSPLFHFFIMTNNLEERIKELVNGILADVDGYLVELRIRPDRVQVFADKDPHITIEDCVQINRRLVKQLDSEFPFSERYDLEVSSPGMDEPLRVYRQFKKCVGRKVDVVLFSGVKKTGTMLFVNEEKLILEEEIAKSKKETESVQSEIPFVQIKSTNLVFNFKM
jgi:ribosome maturation factor RimP